MSAELSDINDDHPLVLELSSLRQTAARFQHEAHQAALKLQRHALVAAQTNNLEAQNSLLVSELATLRAHPLPSCGSQSDAYLVQELTLSLRRSSEKLDLTENILAERTAELVGARNEVLKAQHEADGAYKLAVSARAREEDVKIREREIRARLRATEEERRLIEGVVHEYADLVRSLEGRKSLVGNGSAILQNASASASSLTLVGGLDEGKSSLQRLMSEFASENEQRESTITQLHDQITSLESILESERQAAAQHRAELAKAQLELATLKLDDTTAAKMVSRYMKFSQSQTNALQSTLVALQTRNASTQHTLQSTLNDTEVRLHAQIAENARLRDALEELGEELAREAYGRRREVALRLALLAREEAVDRALRKWVRRAQEGIYRCTDTNSEMYVPFERAVKDAASLLLTLDAELALDNGSKTSGVVGRLVIAKDAVMRMSEEIAVEMRRRLFAEQRLSLGMETLDEVVPESAFVSEKSDTLQALVSINIPGHSAHKQDVELMLDPSSVSTDIPHTQNAISTSPHAPTPNSSFTAEGYGDSGYISPPVVRETTPGTSQLLVDDSPAVSSPSPTVSLSNLTQTPASEVANIPLSSAELSRTPLASVNVLIIEPVQSNYTGENPAVQGAQGPQPQLNDVGPEGSPTSQTLGADEESTVTFAPTAEVTGACAADESSTADRVSEVQLPLLDKISSFLVSLGEVGGRYDTLQRAFCDCSLALKGLKRTLPALTPSSARSLLQTALERISDYTEDAQVELEIRIADEALAIRGFETLLSIPGALSLDSHLEEMRSFIDGTDEGVRKARERLEGKLDDVQHDVAVIKRVIHELQFNEEDEAEVEKVPGDKSWTAWTAGFLPRPSTPAPSQAPTFGSVMTSPQLQHKPTIKQLPSLAGLELKIPMPMPSSPSQSAYGTLGIGPAPSARPRTISMMYSLGIGPRASSLALPGMQPVQSRGVKNNFIQVGRTSHDRNESDVE